jgi:hypothetical protein
MGNISFHPAIFSVFLKHLRETFQSVGDAMIFSMEKDFSNQARLIVGKQIGVGLEASPYEIIEVFAKRMESSVWVIFLTRFSWRAAFRTVYIAYSLSFSWFL